MIRPQRIKTSPAEVVGNTFQILVKILGNLALQPDNPKFKQLKLTNAKIKAAIVDVDGAESLLATAGFTRLADEANPMLMAEGDGLGARARGALTVSASFASPC